MQCNVKCRLPEEDVILKEPPPYESPPQRGHAYIAYSSTNSLKRLMQ